MTAPIIARVDRARIGGRWVMDVVVELSETGMRLVPPDEVPERVRTRIGGVLMPPITDAHVHLGLTDASRREPTALGRVLDLGWAPEALPGLAGAARAAHRGLDVRVAGPFHAAVGGYPSDRAWAPPGAVVQLADADDAAVNDHKRARIEFGKESILCRTTQYDKMISGEIRSRRECPPVDDRDDTFPKVGGVAKRAHQANELLQFNFINFCWH